MAQTTKKMERRAKIVATIGPASQEAEILESLAVSGMDVARLNFSHGSQAEKKAAIGKLREIDARLGRPITILQDLQGPKMRVGRLANEQIELEPGQALTLTTRPVLGNQQVIPVDFPWLIDSVRPGGRILLGDGTLELSIHDVSGDQVRTTVVLGGILKPHKGVNLPGAQLNIPGFTAKDEADLAFGLQCGVDAVAISFVRSGNDVQRVRQAIASLATGRQDLPIIAKLERPEALENLEAIIQAADGVMVARGDLGVEMPPEEVPIAQKRIIESANLQGKLVITATQMLDSMIHSPRPTRAESSDVANAIFDGSDAVMLSGETAAGQYPVEAVRMMDAIVRQAEAHIQSWGRWGGRPEAAHWNDDTFYMTQAARELAHDRHVAALAVFTESGRSARLLSKTRPVVPILAFTPDLVTYRRLSLFWGIKPHLVPRASSIEEIVAAVESTMLASTGLETGQQVVIICGYPVQTGRPTNLALLHTLGRG